VTGGLGKLYNEELAKYKENKMGRALIGGKARGKETTRKTKTSVGG
jgi:hypothetical protein